MTQIKFDNSKLAFIFIIFTWSGERINQSIFFYLNSGTSAHIVSFLVSCFCVVFLSSLNMSPGPKTVYEKAACIRISLVNTQSDGQET